MDPFCGPASYCAPAPYSPCAPAPYAPCAPAPTVAMAPTMAPVGHTAVEAWGRPVYKKKWLLGKWKYAGMSDVKYVPRSHTTMVPTATPVPVAPPPMPMPMVEHCAPTACYDVPCYGNECAAPCAD
eukprot:101608_1